MFILCLLPCQLLCVSGVADNIPPNCKYPSVNRNVCLGLLFAFVSFMWACTGELLWRHCLGKKQFQIVSLPPLKKKEEGKESRGVYVCSFISFEVAGLRQWWVLGWQSVDFEEETSLYPSCCLFWSEIQAEDNSQLLPAVWFVRFSRFTGFGYMLWEDNRDVCREWKCHQLHNSLFHLCSGWLVTRMCVRPTDLPFLSLTCPFLALSAYWGFLFAHQPVLVVGFLCPAHVPSVEWQLKKYCKYLR